MAPTACNDRARVTVNLVELFETSLGKGRGDHRGHRLGTSCAQCPDNITGEVDMAALPADHGQDIFSYIPEPYRI